MALNSKLIQRIHKTTTADVAHSSGYAQAQNANAFGTNAGDTFQDRRALEENRQIVQAYRQARVAQSVNMSPKAMSVEERAAYEAMKRATEQTTTEARQLANSRLEAGGLRRYNKEAQSMSGATAVAKAGGSGGFGRQSAAEMRANRQQAAAIRQAQAQRFSGGVKQVGGGARPMTNTQRFGH